MCDLFAEGKGLEQALTTYLETQRARVERIERGEDIQVFRISAPASSSDGRERRGRRGTRRIVGSRRRRRTVLTGTVTTREAPPQRAEVDRLRRRRRRRVGAVDRNIRPHGLFPVGCAGRNHP
jgi:hypothetical protein